MALGTIAPIARRQHGLITTAQAFETMSRRQLGHLVAKGGLEPVRRGVYRVAGAPESWRQHLLAACLARPGAVASFRAAGALWALDGFEEDALEITVPGRDRARLSDVVVHESQVWGPGHTAIKQAIPVTSVARTLCDLTAAVDARRVERCVDDALRRKLVTVRSLARVADALAAPGRRRCTVTRAILEHRSRGYEPGGSDPEIRIARLLVAAGLPEPVRQHRVRIGRRNVRVDLAYPELMVLIEYDGWDHHSRRSAFNADRARGNELELLGYTVLHFTSASSDATIVATVRGAVTGRGRVGA